MTRPEAGRIGLIAGSGRLPVEVLEGLNRQCENPYVVLIDGEADDLALYRSHDHIRLPVEEFGRLVPLLKTANVTRLVMAGGVARRPAFRNLTWTWSLLGMLPQLAKALASGDDVLLRTVVAHLEAHRIKVVGAHEIVPDLLAKAGIIVGDKPGKDEMRDIRAAAEAARAIGALDIGQAAIAIGGRAIALEGIEGTEGLLERMVAMRGHGRLAGRTGGVLAKCAKPGQELRADLPSIGPDTIEAAFAAGLAGVALEAGRALILDYGLTIARANERGLFIYGLKGDE